jgi:hypothetical protein
MYAQTFQITQHILMQFFLIDTVIQEESLYVYNTHNSVVYLVSALRVQPCAKLGRVASKVIN